MESGGVVLVTDTSVLYSATLTGAGTVRNDGNMNMTGDVANVINLLLQNNGQLQMVNPPQVQVNGRIQNNPGGQVVVQGNGPVNVQVNGQIENKTGAVVAVQGNGKVTLGGTGIFHNAGVARFTGDVSAVVMLWIQNQGLLEFIETPSLQWDGNIQNETGGVVRFQGVDDYQESNKNTFVENKGTFEVLGVTTIDVARAKFDLLSGMWFVETDSAVELSPGTTGTLHNATLQGGGTFRNLGTMYVTGAPPSLIDLLLENHGRVELVQTPSLQLNGQILNMTTAAFVVNGPGECNLDGSGTFRNAGLLVVGNSTTTALANARLFNNGGTVALGTTACLSVYGRGETNQNVVVQLQTGAVYYVVAGGTGYYDRAFTAQGAGTVCMETGRLMFGYFGTTTPVLNVEGGGFEWEGGTISVHPAYQLQNAGEMKVILGGGTNPPLLQGNIMNAGELQFIGLPGVTTPPLQVAGGDIINSKTGTCIFAGQNPAVAGMGFFRNSGDVVFVSGTTGQIGMTFFHHSGTIAIQNASAQMPNGFVMYDGAVQLNNGQWGGMSFSVLGGIVRAHGTMKGNTYHSSGTLSPGQSPGITQAEGLYSQSGTGNLLIEIGGETPGVGYDQLRVTHYASVQGHLTVQLYGGYDPPGGRRFDIITASSISNRFAVTNLPALTGDRQWLVLYRTNSVQLRIATSQDTDGDNLPDVWELQHFGDLIASDGEADDFDADGYPDYFELICDTQPTNNSDFLRWKGIGIGPGGAELTLHTGSNAQYTVESATDLYDGVTWGSVTQFPGIGGDLTRTNSLTENRAFFRIKAGPRN